MCFFLLLKFILIILCKEEMILYLHIVSFWADIYKTLTLPFISHTSNSLITGFLDSSLDLLSYALHTAARIKTQMCKKQKPDNVSSLLRSCQWHPVAGACLSRLISSRSPQALFTLTVPNYSVFPKGGSYTTFVHALLHVQNVFSQLFFNLTMPSFH